MQYDKIMRLILIKGRLGFTYLCEVDQIANVCMFILTDSPSVHFIRNRYSQFVGKGLYSVIDLCTFIPTINI